MVACSFITRTAGTIRVMHLRLCNNMINSQRFAKAILRELNV